MPDLYLYTHQSIDLQCFTELNLNFLGRFNVVVRCNVILFNIQNLIPHLMCSASHDEGAVQVINTWCSMSLAFRQAAVLFLTNCIFQIPGDLSNF